MGLPKIDQHLSKLTKTQSFYIIGLVVILMVASPVITTFVARYYDNKKENSIVKSNIEILQAIKELNQTIIDNNLDAVSRNGAEFIYKKTFVSENNELREVINKFITENNINNSYRQQEIKELLFHRISFIFRNDYRELTRFKYEGVPISYGMKEFSAQVVSDELTTYMFSHSDKDHLLLYKDLTRILDKIFNEFYLTAVNNLEAI